MTDRNLGGAAKGMMLMPIVACGVALDAQVQLRAVLHCGLSLLVVRTESLKASTGIATRSRQPG